MKRHNPMKKAFYFFAVLLLLSCHHASQKGHTVSVRIDPDEAENSIAADEWLDTAGCALIPLADTEKPITNATGSRRTGARYTFRTKRRIACMCSTRTGHSTSP